MDNPTLTCVLGHGIELTDVLIHNFCNVKVELEYY